MTDAQKTYDRMRKANRPTDEIWATMAGDKLLNRRIEHVRYLTDEEAEGLGWYEKSLVIILDDGSYLFASQDDEGNGAGALFTSWEDLQTIPTIRS